MTPPYVPEWVVAEVSVCQGSVDGIRPVARFTTQQEAEAALGGYSPEGHAWSGLTTYRVLQTTQVGYRSPTGEDYPPSGMGF